MTSFQVLGCALLGAVCLLPAACSRPEAPNYDVGNARLQAHYDKASGKLATITYDANKDGKIDTWSVMDGARIVRIEIDTNADGRADRWEYYTPDQKLEKVGWSRARNPTPDAWAYQGPDGKVARVELAAPQGAARDGRPPRVARTEFYENGLLQRAEEDTNGDGRIDKWETYRGGSLATVAFDTTGRGVPDRTLTYGAGPSAEVSTARKLPRPLP